MGYVDDHLLPGEQVVYTGHLHKLVYLGPVVAAMVFIAVGYMALANDVSALAIVSFILALAPLVWAYINYTSSEFAVTNKRVIIKVGFIQRRTLETMLGKVEGIGVDQSLFGRLLDYGTLTVTGTGGTKEPFQMISAPLEFRRQVQGQVSAAEDFRGSTLAAVPAAPRDERDCPFCAERILARAKVCKHCGREVEPLTAT
jgi:uncharacterized membrane protein YdbT with pleckstrin-like domain